MEIEVVLPHLPVLLGKDREPGRINAKKPPTKPTNKKKYTAKKNPNKCGETTGTKCMKQENRELKGLSQRVLRLTCV